MIGEIQYGDVVLHMTWCNFVRHPLLTDDRTTFHFQESSLEVLCVYNPAATAYSAAGADHVPRISNRAFAGETDVSVREYLSQPRRVLLVKYGDDQGVLKPFLESPPLRNNVRLPSDANNGPVCEINSIKEHHGTKTFEMSLVFKTWVACPELKAFRGNSRAAPAGSPVLSHRFRKVIDVNDQFFASIVTTGTVVFDVGRLWAANVSPDFWRSEFFAAPPGNFVREKINVAVESDNAVATYTVIDTQRPFNLGTDTPATRIEAYLTTDYEQGSVAMAQAQVAEDFMGSLFAASLSLNPAGLLVGVPLDMIRSTFRSLRSQLPKYYVSMQLRAWGAPNSTRLDLYKLCAGILLAKMGTTPLFLHAANTTHHRITQEITGKFVEVNTTFRYTDDILVQLISKINAIVTPDPNRAINIRQMLANLGDIVPAFGAALDGIQANVNSVGMAFMAPYLFQGEDIQIPEIAFAAIAPSRFTQESVGNRPPMGKGSDFVASPHLWSRNAKYLEKLMVNGLSGQCENPPIIGRSDASIPSA